MAGGNTVVIALEDLSTAGLVAVEGAHVVRDTDAASVVLLHVLDNHPVVGAMFSAGGQCLQLTATSEEVEMIFSLAEQVLRAELTALEHAIPTIEREVAEGNIPAAIEETATARDAAVIVLGARRPHAFGRLLHPDVRSHVATHAPCPIHVAALQEVVSRES